MKPSLRDRLLAPKPPKSRVWLWICTGGAAPSLVLPILAACLDPFSDSSAALLGKVQLAAIFSSGPGGALAALSEWNFPYSEDWGYVMGMAVSAVLLWATVWYMGENVRGRGPLASLIFYPIVVISWVAGILFHFFVLIAHHT